MFCPECGSDNSEDKRYCRKCGLSLSAVQLALDGRLETAIKISAGEERLKSYRIRVGIGAFLIVVGLLTIFTGGRFGFSNVQSAALVLILMMIFFVQLSRKTHRIARALDIHEQTTGLDRSDANARSIRAANTAALRQAPDGSVTDRETIKLDRPQRR